MAYRRSPPSTAWLQPHWHLGDSAELTANTSDVLHINHEQKRTYKFENRCEVTFSLPVSCCLSVWNRKHPAGQKHWRHTRHSSHSDSSSVTLWRPPVEASVFGLMTVCQILRVEWVHTLRSSVMMLLLLPVVMFFVSHEQSSLTSCQLKNNFCSFPQTSMRTQSHKNRAANGWTLWHTDTVRTLNKKLCLFTTWSCRDSPVFSVCSCSTCFSLTLSLSCNSAHRTAHSESAGLLPVSPGSLTNGRTGGGRTWACFVQQTLDQIQFSLQVLQFVCLFWNIGDKQTAVTHLQLCHCISLSCKQQEVTSLIGNMFTKTVHVQQVSLISLHLLPVCKEKLSDCVFILKMWTAAGSTGSCCIKFLLNSSFFIQVFVHVCFSLFTCCLIQSTFSQSWNTSNKTEPIATNRKRQSGVGVSWCFNIEHLNMKLFFLLSFNFF